MEPMVKQTATIMPSLSRLSITSISAYAQGFGVVIGSAPDALEIGYLTQAFPTTRSFSRRQQRYAIHSVGRWFQQERRAAFPCCPTVTTQKRNPSDLQSAAAR